MDSAQLHAPARPFRIVTAQLATIGIATRSAARIGLVAAAIFALLVARATYGTTALSATRIRLDYVAGSGVTIVLFALFFPLLVWRGEEGGRHAYHWTQPVERVRHSMIRIAGGALWLLLWVAFYEGLFLLLVGAVHHGTHTHALHPIIAWTLLVPFTASVIVYLFGSAIVTGTRYPARWLAGLLPVCVAAYVVVQAVAMRSVLRAAEILWSGAYGLGIALGPAIPDDATSYFVRWVVASFLWGALAVALVWIANARHRDAAVSA